MKRLLIVLFALFIITANAQAGDDEIMYTVTHDAVTIAASANSSSTVIYTGTKSMVGFTTLQVELTGSGTAKFEVLASADLVEYLEPESWADIASGVTVASGPGSDGKAIYQFVIPLCRGFKIKATETGGANSVTITTTLVYQ